MFVIALLRPVALLEFLTRSTGAWIVAAHFFLSANDLLNRLHFSAAGHARLFEFAALAAHEGFFQIVGGSRDEAWRAMSSSARALLRGHSRLRAMARGFGSLRTTRPRIWRTLNNLHQVKIAGRVFLKALQHRLEHLERFFLIFDQRIVLAITAEADALLQMVHAQQVIFPLLVDHAEHDHALVMAHGVRADEFFFRVVAFFQLFENRVAQVLPVQRFRLHTLGDEIDAEAREYSVLQSFNIPVVGVRFRRTVFVHETAKNG